ncbi:MFS transporter [Demequina aurantiaca]|uniref:MFS transporter n=1 Tax=Demequina aurantiaca TaxID=676200 RepID=UPI000784FB95|nr:MFS transporter [Demequina aurantiaca]
MTEVGDSPESHTDDHARRRRTSVLGTSQLFTSVGVASGLAVGSLLAEDITGRTSLSGLPTTAMVLGAAILAVPLARFASRSGRRNALITGLLIAALGSATIILAAAQNLFPLLLLGALLVGGGTATGLQARYAATDNVPTRHRGRSLSIVVWASTAGAVLGPNLIDLGATVAHALTIPDLAGPWVLTVAALLVSVVILGIGLRGSGPVGGNRQPASIRITLAAVVSRRDGLIGLVSLGTGHAVMVGIMAMSAVHLHGHGSSFTFIGLVISIHVAGMYAFSPLFGAAVDRWGAIRVIVLGVALLCVGALATMMAGFADGRMDHGAAQQWITGGLLVIGLGWSACMIAGSTLLSTGAHEADERVSNTDVQGTSDLIMGLAGATAGAGSGAVLAWVGYSGLSLVGIGLLVPLLILLMVKRPAAPQVVPDHALSS